MISSFQEELKAYLKQEDRFIPKILAKIEKATGVNREHVVYAIASILSLYLIVGQRAALLCNAIGVVYPIFASLRTIQLDDNHQSNKRWLSYWSLFGIISIFDETIGYFPLYWLIKCLVLLALYLPMLRGAERLYTSVLAPAFNRLYPTIDQTHTQLKATAEQIIKEEKQKLDNMTPPETPSEP